MAAGIVAIRSALISGANGDNPTGRWHLRLLPPRIAPMTATNFTARRTAGPLIAAILFLAAGAAAMAQAGDAPQGAADEKAAENNAKPADDLQPQVDRWVRRLSSSELSARTEAEEKLLALGPRILDLLPTFKEGGPASEAQKRDSIARIRRQLERQYAAETTQGSTVTLHVANKPLAEVLAEVTRQTGNKFKDVRRQMGQEVPDPKLTLDFDKAPFWEALDKTLDQAGATLYHFTENDTLGIVARGDKELPRYGRASYAGPLRIEATRLDAARNLRGAGDDSVLKVTLEIAWEPRMRPILIRQVLSELKATDDRGEAIKISGTEGQLERPLDAAGTATEFTIPLLSPARAAAKIASLKGKLRVILPAKNETFEFTELKNAKKVEQRKAGVIVTLDEVRQNNDAWEVRIRAKFDKTAGAFDTFLGWVFNNEAFLVGADGKRVAHSGFQTTKQTEDEIGVAYLFDPPTGVDGLKFVYKTPAMLSSIPLDFELKDIPLP